MRRFESTPAMLVAAVALLLPACERSEQPAATSKPASSATTSTRPSADELANVRQFVQTAQPQAAPTLPPGHPPIGEAPAPPAGLDIPTPGVTPVGLKYDAPPTWQKEPVKGGLRLAQFRWPRAAGDAEDGELVVFGPNIGGGVDANIERWRSQFAGPDSQPVSGDAFRRETFEVAGLRVTLVEIAGRFSAGTMSMMGGSPPPAKDDYRMLGAIVETTNGPWYFKAYGPTATMTAHREEFLTFLRAMKPE